MMMTVDQSELSAERLRLLYRLSQTFNSSLDLDEVLNRVMDEVIAVTRAERGFVMLPESDGQLYFHAARGIEQQTIDTPEFHISRGLVDRVAAERQPLLTSDAQSDDRLSMRRSVVNLGLRSILCVPMLFRDKLVGVIYVDNRLQAGLFTQAELELLTAVAASAAIAIDNARLYQLAIEKGRMEQELQMARDLQRSLLPQYAPRLAVCYPLAAGAPGGRRFLRLHPHRRPVGVDHCRRLRQRHGGGPLYGPQPHRAAGQSGSGPLGGRYCSGRPPKTRGKLWNQVKTSCTEWPVSNRRASTGRPNITLTRSSPRFLVVS
jgi:hypothetical protein